MAEYTYRTLEAYLKHYEKQKDAAQVDPYEEMLDLLSAPYNDLRNYDEFLAALKELLTPEETEVWRFYPDYTLHVSSKSPREIQGALRPELQSRVEALSRSLAEKMFLFEQETPAGEPGYIRTYFFFMVYWRYLHPDDTLLTKAAERWWKDVVERGDSALLRGSGRELRVLPHEGALTGDSRHGKVPVHLDIPDTRTLLPMDSAEEILKGCRRFAVTKCICRTLKDRDHSRPCSFPVDDVCIALDQMADNTIAMGIAREISREETLQIIRRCRDLGMVQTISNAVHPLAICNCCKCCCACLRMMERYEDMLCVPSRYAAEAAHPESCIACGKCAKCCPMDAVVIAKDGGTYVKAQQCIGCGVCVSQCPKAVLKLVKRPGAPERPERDNIERIYM